MSEKLFDIGALEERLGAVVRSRRVIILTTVVASTTALVRQLLRYAAQRPLVIAHGPGLGDLPADGEAEIVLHPLPEQPTLMSEELQAHIAFVADLPQPVVDAMRAYDPDSCALLWLLPIVGAPETFLGRRVLGGRRPDWARLEDKTVGDEIFDAAGVTRPQPPRRPSATSRPTAIAYG